MIDRPNRSKRFRNFSLRALLALTAVLGIVLAVYVAVYIRPLRQQAAAIERIRTLGGIAQVTTLDMRHVEKVDEVAQNRIERMLGINPAVRVPTVDLTSDSISAEAVRSMIPHLQNLIPGPQEPGENYVALDVAHNPNIDEELLSQMRGSLPNCRFVEYTPVPEGVRSAVRPGLQQQDVANLVGSLMYDQRNDWVGPKQPIVDMLGAMHKTFGNTDGTESWAYYTDDVGIGVFHVEFDADGVVTKTWTGRGVPGTMRNRVTSGIGAYSSHF